MIPSITNAVKVVALATPDLEKLKKATDGLESFMFKSLLKNIGGKNGLFGSKMPGSDVYQDMFEQNLADTVASHGQVGIGKTIYNSVAPLAAQQAIKKLQAEARLTQQELTLEKKA